MENDSLPTENIKSSKDQSEIVDSYSANPNQIVYDLLHQSDFDINVADAYFAKKVNAPNEPNEYTYLKLNQASLGDKIYLVVKCYGKPPKGSLVISIRELERKGTEQNLYLQNPITFLVDGVEKSELQFRIYEKIEYIQEIEIRPKDDKEYQELQDKLNSLENKSTRLTIRTEIKYTNATKVNFKGILTGEFDTVKGSRYYDFLNEEKESFEVKYCPCCKYYIKNNLLYGPNVIRSKKGNKVVEDGDIESIVAIILHRTSGSHTNGAIRRNIGAHFYIDGNDKSQGNDGEIFQTVALDKATKHITDETSRKAEIGKIMKKNSIGIEVVGRAFNNKNGIYYDASTDIELKNLNIDILDSEEYFPKNKNKKRDLIIRWEKLTEKQIQSTACLVNVLMKQYNLKIDDIYVHEEIQSKTNGEGMVVKKAILPFLKN